MPRFDFLCKDCLRETILYVNPGTKINVHAWECEHCQSMNTEMIGFYENQKAQILHLQYQIEDLITQVDKITDAIGLMDLPDPECDIMN